MQHTTSRTTALSVNDISLLVSNGTNCLNFFIQFEFWSPPLHQHLCLHSTCHLNNKTYPLTPDLPWHLYLQCTLCILYWLLDSHKLYKQMSSSLCTCYLYTTTFPVYPLLTTSTLYWIITNASTTNTTWPSYSLLCYLLSFPLIITLVLFIFTLMPLFCTLFFPSFSFLIRSSSHLAIRTRSSAYNNSHGKATVNSLDKASMTVTESKGLNAEPWCIATHTHTCRPVSRSTAGWPPSLRREIFNVRRRRAPSSHVSNETYSESNGREDPRRLMSTAVTWRVSRKCLKRLAGSVSPGFGSEFSFS